MRGQVELPAVGIALLLLTMTLVLGVGFAESALTAADRSPVEREAAVSISDRLVDDSAKLTARNNVFVATAPADLDAQRLHQRYGLPESADARITLDGEVVASTGSVRGGTTIERIVLLEQRSERTIRPEFSPTRTVTLPRRTDSAAITLSPPVNTTVATVWANDRVLLSNDEGLVGEHDVSLSPYETTTLRFEAIGPLDSTHVAVEFYPPETRKAVLEVTVDA